MIYYSKQNVLNVYFMWDFIKYLLNCTYINKVVKCVWSILFLYTHYVMDAKCALLLNKFRNLNHFFFQPKMAG